MRTTLWLGFVCALGAAAINACGDGSTGGNGTEGTGDGGTGGSTTTTTTTTTTTMATGGAGGTGGSASNSSSSSSSSASSSGSMLVNGCDPAAAEDHTADTDVTITFGGGLGLKYSPACIKIKTGTNVTFSGSFVSHPLGGGADGNLDPSSPIAETKTGMAATFTFANAGTFPYYCEAHVSSGMKGAIFVQ